MKAVVMTLGKLSEPGWAAFAPCCKFGLMSKKGVPKASGRAGDGVSNGEDIDPGAVSGCWTDEG